MSATKRRLWAAFHLAGLSPREVAVRAWHRMDEHEIFTRAAAITFYAIAALVPFLALVITMTAHLLPPAIRLEASGTSRPAGPADEIVGMLPGDAASIVVKEIQRLQEGPSTGPRLVRPGGDALAVLERVRGRDGRHEPDPGGP